MLTTQSFWELLSDSRAIAIPLLQRDYAQGRPGAATADIRTRFVQALHGAFDQHGKAGQAIGLDFVYGTRDQQTLTPLDGQQRLTTLFLLHWYLAAGAAVDASAELGRFSYQGRAAARDFCAALVETLAARAGRPGGVGTLSAALRDQPWFLPAWPRDPTVRGMLTMLDALDQTFAGLPAAAAWAALTGPAAQAPVTFQFLDLEGNHLTDDLYTRMNARGKPLTQFENWKARFDELLNENASENPVSWTKYSISWADKLEGTWTDFFWQNKSSDVSKADPAAQVDAPFVACLDFITRMLGLRALASADKATAQAVEKAALPFSRYEEVYAATEAGVANLAFLMAALDALATAPPMPELFDGLLTTGPSSDDRVRLFEGWGEQAPTHTNLFRLCCQTASPSPIAQVLFFTVLTYGAQHGTLRPDPALRDLLRLVRNRLLAMRGAGKFSFTLDPTQIERMLPALLNEITGLTHLTLEHNCAYTALAAWAVPNTDWAAEQHKAHWLQPGSKWRARLLAVEDSEHFRGTLHLLNDPAWPSDEALDKALEAIESLWLNPAATADAEFTSLVVRALAATPGADFCTAVGPYRFWGGGPNGWNLLVAASDAPARTAAFKQFADLFGQTTGDWKSRLKHVITQQLPARRQEALASNSWRNTVWEKQWPYYMAKYPGMTFQDKHEYPRCYYKWWNWQYGDRDYHSCALLSKTTMSGTNFHPFAYAAVEEWNDQVKAGVIQEGIITLDSPEDNGADEFPLYLKRRNEEVQVPETIKLFYGHIDPCGWRLALPKHLMLAPAVAARFIWREHTSGGTAVRQMWLTGVVGQQLDDIETVIEFAKSLAEPSSLLPLPVSGS